VNYITFWHFLKIPSVFEGLNIEFLGHGLCSEHPTRWSAGHVFTLTNSYLLKMFVPLQIVCILSNARLKHFKLFGVKMCYKLIVYCAPFDFIFVLETSKLFWGNYRFCEPKIFTCVLTRTKTWATFRLGQMTSSAHIQAWANDVICSHSDLSRWHHMLTFRFEQMTSSAHIQTWADDIICSHSDLSRWHHLLTFRLEQMTSSAHIQIWADDIICSHSGLSRWHHLHTFRLELEQMTSSAHIQTWAVDIICSHSDLNSDLSRWHHLLTYLSLSRWHHLHTFRLEFEQMKSSAQIQTWADDILCSHYI
jgi:hypothetical protein